MKLVIDISDDTYHTILTTHDNMIFDSDSPYVAIAIKNGTPLPKGHGRLIDADALMRDYGNPDVEILLDNMDTIIEADKEQKDGNGDFRR